jgi:hypothetical protein
MKMIRKAMLAIITTIGLGLQSFPIAAQTIKGSGNDNCGEWLKYRQRLASQRFTDRDVLLLNMEQSWIDGFVSGIAAFKSVDLLESHPGEGMYVFVDNYCRSNPLDRILSATIALVGELGAQARRNK